LIAIIILDFICYFNCANCPVSVCVFCHLIRLSSSRIHKRVSLVQFLYRVQRF